MSWNDFYRRYDALNAVLEHARRDPASTLPFDEVAGVAEVFASPAELLRALHHRWLMALTGRVEIVLAETERDPDVDSADAVLAAWRSTATWNDVLRRLLDANLERYAADLRPALEGEQRMLALAAGLVEPHEPRAEITRIGAAYYALLHTSADRTPRRRNPVEQLLRRLVPSA